jgi:hypothetical protein
MTLLCQHPFMKLIILLATHVILQVVTVEPILTRDSLDTQGFQG